MNTETPRAAFWLEWAKEIRRYAGDERLPWALRSYLREHSRRALARARTQTSRDTSAAPIPSAEVPSTGAETAAAQADYRHSPGGGCAGAGARSRILFVMLHPGFVRYFERALYALAEAGHHVHVAFELNRTKLGEDITARRLAAASPRITCGTTPERPESVRDFLARGDRDAVRSGDGVRATTREERWESLATTVRLLQDYLRFFDPAFQGAAALRARARKRLPRIYASVVDWCAPVGQPVRRLLSAGLRLTERIAPVPDAIAAFVREQQPDVVLVTPLIELGSQQVDYVKCARRLGVPSALAVASWDNLTSKGLVRVAPDRVIVWNDAQRREALDLHGVPADRVEVTGAVAFDRWFDATPGCSREEFCRRANLDPTRPFVLYVGSSTFIAPDEVPFVQRWLRHVRAAEDSALASAGVLVRPHPANTAPWREFDATATANVALWPLVDLDPTAPGFWADYHDSLYYSAAVVGINTSAQIEAAIVGRPVLTIRDAEFAHAQEGTLHFRHLVSGGGVVRAAMSFDQHVQQLAAALRDGADLAATRQFVCGFVRPKGLDVPAANLFAEAVERLAVVQPLPMPDTWWVRMLRPAGLAAASVARLLAEDRPLWVYGLRLPISAGVRMAAVGYRCGQWWHESQLPKKARRLAWRAWYESASRVRRDVRRAAKPARNLARRASGAARRVVRREL